MNSAGPRDDSTSAFEEQVGTLGVGLLGNSGSLLQNEDENPSFWL